MAEIVKPNCNTVIQPGKNFVKLKMNMDGLKPKKKFCNGKEYDESSCDLSVTFEAHQVVVDMQLKTGSKTHYKLVKSNAELEFPSIDVTKQEWKVKPDRLTVHVHRGR